jgi:hypothetical protein
MRLTPEQEMHLENVRRANENYQSAKRSAPEEIARRVEQHLGDLRARVDNLVRVAYASGVPKRRIGVSGLRTSASVTVTESLARTEGLSCI